MNHQITLLSKQTLEALKSQHEVLQFKNDFFLVYERQIPNAGIALVEGEIQLTENKKTRELVPAGNLLGVHEILCAEPVPFGFKVKKDSKVILLGKSELMDSIKDHKSPLFDLLRSYRHLEA